MTRPLIVTLALSVAASLIAVDATAAPRPTPAQVSADCNWVRARLAAEPERDDAFGVVLRNLQGRCGKLAPAAAGDTFRVSRAHVQLAEDITALRDAIGSEPTPAPRPPAAPREDPPVQAAPEPQEEAPRAERARPIPVPGEAAPAPAARTRAPAAPAATAPAPAPAPRGEGVTGTWNAKPEKRLDKTVTRRLELVQVGKKVTGKLFVDESFPAPREWVERSCGGNPTFRLVTVASVKGKRKGRTLELRRDKPRVVSCTCPSRCRTDKRKRGFELTLAPGDDYRMAGGPGDFTMEGAPQRVADVPGGGATPGRGGAAAPASRTFAGLFESRPYERSGATRVLRIELTVEEGKARGSVSERHSQPLPLENWSDRFCDGKEIWEYVEVFRASGDVGRSGEELVLKLKSPRVLACTCPSKCRTPKRRRAITLRMSRDGRSVIAGDRVLNRVVEPIE